MKRVALQFFVSSLLASPSFGQSCPDYSEYSKQRNTPFSTGRFELAYQRPDPPCRTFISSTVDETIRYMSSVITDPDLYRLFENTFPNTLDTAIKWWRGHARDNPNEELAFVVTGDINAMWLRDSANQMKSYQSLLVADSSSDSLAGLFRGVINLQARYILNSPYCNAFQPPEESNLDHAPTGGSTAQITPPYDTAVVFECKFELDSLASFLDISYSYFNATNDSAFFGEHQWMAALQRVLDTALSMELPTYRADGSVIPLPYTFQQETRRATETLANDGMGSPAASITGNFTHMSLIRSAFRPSDDSTMLPYHIPSNMMFVQSLRGAAAILTDMIYNSNTSVPLEIFGLPKKLMIISDNISNGIDNYGVVPVWSDYVYSDSASRNCDFGVRWAYEVDGFGSAILMDDANLPSLLAMPLMGYRRRDDMIYQVTRARILSSKNPYFMRGPVLNAVGGPHVGPGMAWPMASIVRIMTSDDDDEIESTLRELVGSTAGLGLIHESVNASDAQDWTRQWFSWANGLFGQMILDLAKTRPHLLTKSYQ